MNEKSNEYIDITIKVGNSLDWNKIVVGKSYYFNMKRNTLIKELFNEFIKKFPEELKEDIKKYNLHTKKFIKLHDNDMIQDSFTNIDDSDLNIYDNDETIFYAVLWFNGSE